MRSVYNPGHPFSKLSFLLTICFALCTGFQSALAVPAYPHPVEYTQPDGTTITIRLRGDERINWAETMDGYSILARQDGFYVYAVRNEEGDMVPGEQHVSPIGQRDEEELKLLEHIPRGLFFSDRQTDMMVEVWRARKEAASRSFPSTGERSLIAILMETPDVPFSKTQEDFDALFNQVGYSYDGASGSVKDYYLENSYGLFDLTVDVTGPYTTKHNMAHYGSTWAGARQLATEAVHLAHPDVNYADYDNSGDGWVDGVYMIFAGYGEEAGGGPNTIWSHAWTIDPVQLDGVWISRYACSPELRGNSGNNITRIGVIGHEFGHILGAPDYYDTDGDGSGGSFTGTGSWDMMAGGTWNNGGATPAHHNPYTKIYTYNWATPNILNRPDTITMLNSAEHDDHFYRVNTNTPGEYYLLENRLHTGFDTHVPGEGLIIYHVHKEVATSGNQVNVGHPQKMYPVCAGATTNPTGPPWTYGNINSAQTPFPGNTNQTSFTDHSTPSSESWAGEHTNKPITGISRDAANQTVSFVFMADTQGISDWVHWDDGIHEGSVGLGSGGIYQVAQRFAAEDLIPYEGFRIDMLRIYVGDLPAQAAIKIWQGETQDSLQEVVHQDFTPQESGWIEVVLDHPHVIDTGKELWFGMEYDDPGAGTYTASRDIRTDYDGKGNLIRMDVDDHTAWTMLSAYDIEGDWNIQARISLADHLVVHFSAADNHGSIKAFANGQEISPGEAIPQGTEITFYAYPDDGFEVKEWTKNGVVMDDYHADSLHIPGIDDHLAVIVAFGAVYHTIDYYVDGGNGELYAQSGNADLVPGDTIQQGDPVLFIADPAPGYRVQAWYLNGQIAEGFTQHEYDIASVEEDVTMSVVFEEAVSAGQPLSETLSVYPNPAGDYIRILAGEVIDRVELINMQGQTVTALVANTNDMEISLEEIPSGIYLLRIEAGEAVISKRIQLVN